MEHAARLQAEAARTDERRLLVLAGSEESTRETLQAVLDAVDATETVYVGPDSPPGCQSLSHSQTDTLLGTTQTYLVYDCHERCEPNTLGQLVGTVEGGGLFVLLTPPLEAWPATHDGFDETLAVPPFETELVGTAFRQRLVDTLRDRPGISILDTDANQLEKDGLIDPPPRLPAQTPTAPAEHSAFPAVAYEQCLTADQAEAVESFERLCTDQQALIVESNRGRGKSSAAGLAAACLADQGSDVLVTAPGYRSVATLFERAVTLLAEMNAVQSTDGSDPPRRIETATGRIRFESVADATALPGDPDCVIVDEAAALPVGRLESLLAVDRIAFVTTTHGYEGAGRGFSVRFRDRLTESHHEVTHQQLATPIRHAPADPVEVWSFRALGLGARPAPEQLLRDATPETVRYRQLSTAELREHEHLLREVFGLLVFAHYRTEPNDFARLLDAPNVTVHALCLDGHAVSVALLAREGGLSAPQRERIYGGERIRGNLIPDLLTSQLRDRDAGRPVGDRVMRIATHSAVRSRGLGSTLLAEIRENAKEQGRDWVGVGYGATPQLVDFWSENGYRAVHLSITRNQRSGEHSVIMLSALSRQGQQLTDRHSQWFRRRLPGTLTNALDSLDPDVVRAVCGAIDGRFELSLSEQEWHMLEGIPDGTAIYDIAPHPVTMFTLHYLTDSDADCLGPRQERLLVRKALQATPWDEVATEMEYDTSSTCMRALGDAIAPLLARYRPTESEPEGPR